jgi:hypothetical protein
VGDILPDSDPTKETAIKREITVAQQMGPGSSTAALADVTYSAVYINPVLVNRFTQPQVAAMIVHEAMHVHTQLIDAELQSRMFGATSDEVGRASANISNRIEQNCFTGGD